MASQAQIEANRRNSQRSTGPKTEAGKARAKLNALKDGSHAKTVTPVLPQEDPVELDRRINQWLSDLNPRNDAERELVVNAANLSWELERARRCETARLAQRVRKAQHKATKRTKQEVGQLARRLLYNVGSKSLPTPGRPWEDNPAEFLAGLEESAEGCRWLLGRWKGLRVLLDRNSAWNYGDIFSLIRLLGKYPFDAINDPELNGIFLAFDVVEPGRAVLEGVQAVQADARSGLQRLRPLARDRRPARRRGRSHQVPFHADRRAIGPAGGAAGIARRDRRRRRSRTGGPGVV